MRKLGFLLLILNALGSPALATADSCDDYGHDWFRGITAIFSLSSYDAADVAQQIYQVEDRPLFLLLTFNRKTGTIEGELRSLFARINYPYLVRGQKIGDGRITLSFFDRKVVQEIRSTAAKAFEELSTLRDQMECDAFNYKVAAIYKDFNKKISALTPLSRSSYAYVKNAPLPTSKPQTSIGYVVSSAGHWTLVRGRKAGAAPLKRFSVVPDLRSASMGDGRTPISIGGVESRLTGLERAEDGGSVPYRKTDMDFRLRVRVSNFKTRVLGLFDDRISAILKVAGLPSATIDVG